MYILVAILMFTLLIAIHEFGHFAVAKLCGVQVNEFAIGMGPAIVQRKFGETMYSLRWIPAGGYCAMEGEDEESTNPRSFNSAKTWKKIAILVAGAFMNFLLGFFIIFVLMATASGFLMPTIGGFTEGYNNEDCGLQANDIIYAVNGQPIYTYGNFSQFISRAGDTIDFDVERDGIRMELKNVHLPVQQKIDENGNVTYLRGIYIGRAVFDATTENILLFSWYNCLDFVRLVYMSLLDLISGVIKPADMSGAVGIVDTIAQVGEASEDVSDASVNISYIAALITINLAVMNLLPFPALDGGRILFILLNSIFFAATKKNVPVKYEAYFHGAGLLVLLCFMGYATFNDISRIITR